MSERDPYDLTGLNVAPGLTQWQVITGAILYASVISYGAVFMISALVLGILWNLPIAAWYALTAMGAAYVCSMAQVFQKTMWAYGFAGISALFGFASWGLLFLRVVIK